ncbi:MAG: response regulator transcription factor [Halofilum sp. (in: g-proteobacteria)]|nr:response regulator transcription factor [Halofilum sp. (in: g-proteobacteria)]
MRLLLIEDDFRIASFICKGMREAGFMIEHASSGDTGLAMALDNDYDAAIVDLMLPGRDGLDVIDEMRRHQKRLPVIILSARRSVDERIRGLQAGGDDYLTKPFSFSELLARVQALIRRANETSQPAGLAVGDLSIDLLTHDVRRGDQRIALQPREFALLEYLMRNSGRVVSKTMIMEHVWDYNFDPHTNVVESRICRLREKVDRGFDAPLIHTVRGLGYVLRESS